MSVKFRLPKIKQASQNVVLTLPGRAISHYAQRSLSNQFIIYQQKIQWHKRQAIEDIKFYTVECKCHKVTGTGYYDDCPGNCNGTVCYHSLAALTKQAAHSNKTLSLFDNFSDACRYANFGGQLVKINSAQSDGYCWGVVK